MTLRGFFLELLFPTQCIICEKSGKYLCGSCYKRIPIKRYDLCPLCQNTETFAGRVCNLCENTREKYYLDGIIVASYYKHPILREVIHRYKYGFIKRLAWPLSKVLARKLFYLEKFPFEEFSFTAVPLHSKRLSWRGFNQAEFLGKKIQKIFIINDLDIKFIPDLLERKIYIKPQMKIHSTEDREKNIVGSFSINPKYQKIIKNKSSFIKVGKFANLPKKVIIVDDVLTTGATLNECAKILKKHGVEKVWGLVMARQSR